MIALDRRQLLTGSALLLGGAMMPRWAGAAAPTLPAFYEDIERRTFRWFWDTVNPRNGLVPDRWPTPSFSSIAAVGFALPAYAIGVERGWCTRARGARSHADDAALLLERAAGSGTDGKDRPPRLLLPLPRHGNRAAVQGCRAVERRHHDPADGCAVRGPILRPRRCCRSGDPQAFERSLRARRLEFLPHRRPRGDVDGLAPRRRADPGQLGRLQRGHVRQHPCARLADASGSRQSVAAVDRALSRNSGAGRDRRGGSPSRLCSATSTATSSSTSAASATR